MDQLIPVERAAKMLGVHPKTVRHWDEQGKIRVVRTPGGKRRIPESEIRRLRGEAPPATKQRVLAVYARVSSHDQKRHGDLERQVAHIRAVMEPGADPPFAEVVTITDVASGLSDKRPGLLRLMSLAREGRITDLAVTYRDRLTRLGFGYLEQFFTGYGVRIHAVNGGEDRKSLQEELADDLISIVTSFSGKLYGLRSHGRAHELVSAVRGAVSGAGDVPGEDRR
jgi:putative resolvase